MRLRLISDRLVDQKNISTSQLIAGMNSKKIIVILGFQITILGGLSGLIDALGLTTGFYFWIMVLGVLITATAFIGNGIDSIP